MGGRFRSRLSATPSQARAPVPREQRSGSWLRVDPDATAAGGRESAAHELEHPKRPDRSRPRRHPDRSPPAAVAASTTTRPSRSAITPPRCSRTRSGAPTRCAPARRTPRRPPKEIQDDATDLANETLDAVEDAEPPGRGEGAARGGPGAAQRGRRPVAEACAAVVSAARGERDSRGAPALARRAVSARLDMCPTRQRAPCVAKVDDWTGCFWLWSVRSAVGCVTRPNIWPGSPQT